LAKKSFDDLDLLELIRLQSLLADSTGSDVKVISVVMAYGDVAVSAGDPIALVGFYQDITYGF
jgi:hypothetical protein